MRMTMRRDPVAKIHVCQSQGVYRSIAHTGCVGKAWVNRYAIDKSIGSIHPLEGSKEVKDASFFEGIDWETLADQTMQHIPTVTNIEDTRYFEGDMEDFLRTMASQGTMGAGAGGPVVNDLLHFGDFYYKNVNLLMAANATAAKKESHPPGSTSSSSSEAKETKKSLGKSEKVQTTINTPKAGTSGKSLDSVSSGASRPVASPSTPVQKAVPGKSELIETAMTMECMVAEDNPIIQKITKAGLKSLGIQVDTATNGREVVDMAGKKSYTIIFMDIMMPELDGLQSTRLIRFALECHLQLKKRVRSGDGPSKRCVIVAFTALGNQSEDYTKAGLNDYLPKPFNKTDLYNILNKWVKVINAGGDGINTNPQPTATAARRGSASSTPLDVRSAATSSPAGMMTTINSGLVDMPLPSQPNTDPQFRRATPSLVENASSASPELGFLRRIDS